MAVSIEEQQLLRLRLLQQHRPETLALASMTDFFWYVSGGFGPLIQQGNMRLLMECVHARLAELDISDEEFEAAMMGVFRVNRTCQELAALPEEVDDEHARSSWKQLSRRYRV